MKIEHYENQEKFLEHYENEIIETEIIIVVETEDKISADLETNCKSYKTAIKRLFKGIKNYKEFDGWESCILEGCESGEFKGIDEEYHYSIENIYDNNWYLEITVTK